MVRPRAISVTQFSLGHDCAEKLPIIAGNTMSCHLIMNVFISWQIISQFKVLYVQLG